VRAHYNQALTASTQDEREEWLAKTFRGLGHLFHLIQDAAVPAHTRNDAHAFYTYESFVLEVQQEEGPSFQSRLTAINPDQGWTGLAPNPLAPAPIARLIDTDRYTETNPGVTTEPLIGIAEYTNANFLSEDTRLTRSAAGLIPPSGLPFPAGSSVQIGTHQIELRRQDGTSQTVNRLYYNKVADGDTGYRLATVGILEDYIQRFNLDPGRLKDRPALDEGVYRDYAARLLPRAVGYSTALLDYFFRGQVTVFRAGQAEAAGWVRVRVQNPNNERMTGTVSLYYDDSGDGRRKLVPLGPYTFGMAVDLPPAGISGDFEVPTPAGEAGQYVAVFSGLLGNEQSAVIPTRVQIAPPSPGPAHVCRGPSSSCWAQWFVPAGATLTVQGSGSGTGTLRAHALSSSFDPYCPPGSNLADCVTESSASGGSFSITAPAPPGAVYGQIDLDLAVESGSYVCIFDPPKSNFAANTVQGFGYANCP
jgi:hypothetical protein